MTSFRAAKTTRNNDDFKVLMTGLIGAILLLTIIPIISQNWVRYGATRPFVHAETLQLVTIEGSSTPGILYDADANRSVESTWIATVESGIPSEGPINLIRGEAAYSIKAEDGPKVWTWESWFDNGYGADIPPIPTTPFQVCVRYVSVTTDTGITDETPKKCSDIYTP